jgi:hypothetical protein
MRLTKTLAAASIAALTTAPIAAPMAALIAAPAALAQQAPQQAPQQADVKKAVDCQTLVSQFTDGVVPSKASDDAKKEARALMAEGSKACNEKNYDEGTGKVREALAKINAKPIR